MVPAIARGGRLWTLYVAVLAALWMTTGIVLAEAPQVGQVQKLQVITFSLQVGSTDKETKRVIYSPPPGWYVRSHAVDCAAKHGNTSFSVSTIPQNWCWLSEERIDESYKLFLGLAVHAHNAGLQARLKQERSRLLNELHTVRSSHHALVLDATVKGEGLLKGGGGIQLTVTAELVYIGTDESWSRTLAQCRRESK